MGCVRRLDFIEHAVQVSQKMRQFLKSRSNFPCDACDKLLIRKEIFQTHQAGAHNGNQFIIQIKENPDGVEGEPDKELREKR